MFEELIESTRSATRQLYSVNLKERFIHLFEGCSITPSKEQIEKVRGMSWEEIAEAPYQLLDDIDTASDMCKEDMQAFQDVVLEIQQKKNLYMYSPDGYDVKRIGEAWEPGDKFDLGDKRYKILHIKDDGKTIVAIDIATDKVEEIPLETAVKSEAKLKEDTVDHARRELELAGMFDKEVDGSKPAGEWNIMTAEAVLELMELFAKQRHSGASAGMTRELFSKLSNFETLTELTDNKDEWMNVTDKAVDTGKPLFQSRRSPSCFSEDNGKTYYNLNDDCFKFEDEEDGLLYTSSPESRGVERTIHTSKHID